MGTYLDFSSVRLSSSSLAADFTEHLYSVVIPSYTVHAPFRTHITLSLSGLSHFSVTYQLFAIRAHERTTSFELKLQG